MSDFVFNKKPIATESGEGSYLYSDDGIEYLDFGVNYAVAASGRSHPAVTSAIQEQAAKPTYVQTSYPVEVRTELHEKLATLTSDDISNVWLCNSGTETNEATMKLACSMTGRQKVVAMKRAFHDRALGSLALMWKQKYKKPYEPVAGGVEFVSYGDEAELAKAIGDEMTAVFLEPIQGEGGINSAVAEYLQTVRDLADDVGAAFVFDEIQTGIGRTGALWVRESAGVVLDTLTSAKGIANGLPLGVALCADQIANGVASHGLAFSGGPVVYTMANATLGTIVKEDLPGHTAVVGDYLTTGLEVAVEEHDLSVREVRDDGLTVNAEAKCGANRMLKHPMLPKQLLALPVGRTVARFLPLLVIEEEHIDYVVDTMTNVLS